MSFRTREISPVRERELAQARLEKRREQRRKASGTVCVSFRDARARQIEGRLIDMSHSGFRMAHGETSLPTGQVVEFSHSQSSGQARVMWNRIAGGTVETGFLVIGR
jgi:hypothetical protein